MVCRTLGDQGHVTSPDSALSPALLPSCCSVRGYCQKHHIYSFFSLSLFSHKFLLKLHFMKPQLYKTRVQLWPLLGLGFVDLHSRQSPSD